MLGFDYSRVSGNGTHKFQLALVLGLYDIENGFDITDLYRPTIFVPKVKSVRTGFLGTIIGLPYDEVVVGHREMHSRRIYSFWKVYNCSWWLLEESLS